MALTSPVAIARCRPVRADFRSADTRARRTREARDRAFQTSCTAAAQPAFGRAMALLHSFEFAPAIESFTAAGTADPGCAIASWGIAVSRWGNPFAAGIKSPAQLEAGRAAIAKARTIGAKTERERDYIAAAGASICRLREGRPARRGSVPTATRWPDSRPDIADDPEASAFYAWRWWPSNDPTDQTYAEPAQGRRDPRAARTDSSPTIRASCTTSSTPTTCRRSRRRRSNAARRYAKIAPSAPHALHMPSHTFTRLGYWQESIDTNIASASGRAARGSDRRRASRDGLPGVRLSAAGAGSRGADAWSTRCPRSRLASIRSRIGSAAPGSAGVFALAAIPARYALERRAWDEAARLELRPAAFRRPTRSPGSRAASARRAQEICRSARAAIDALQQLEAQLTKAGESYWAEQVAIQRLGVSAWIALKDGRTDEALTTMRSAADREDRTEKNAVTPGPIAPARELLGYMLIETKRPAEALDGVRHHPGEGAEPLPRARRRTGGSTDVRAARRPRRKYLEPLLTLTAKADVPGRPRSRR